MQDKDISTEMGVGAVVRAEVGVELDLSLLMLQGVMNPSRVKKIRKKYGMFQRDFADLIGVAYDTYSSWERGARNPSSPSCSLLQIAEKQPTVFLQNRREIIDSVMRYFKKKG
jgi:DNA-binding transcriptional regulator YiaG